VRQHKGSFPLDDPDGSAEWRKAGRCATGSLEQREVKAPVDAVGRPRRWRAVRLTLDEPTRDGETEVVLITNLPARVPARAVAEGYRGRWTIERHWQRLTDHLHCEQAGLGRPRAALFAFALSLVAANVLALVEGALAAAHGPEVVAELSYARLADEVAYTWRGMLVALPPSAWAFVRAMPAKTFAALLLEVAGHADPARLRKARRGPKKKKRTPNCTNVRHRSTCRVLAEAKRLADAKRTG
jgi:hypothetical protein